MRMKRADGSIIERWGSLIKNDVILDAALLLKTDYD